MYGIYCRTRCESFYRRNLLGFERQTKKFKSEVFPGNPGKLSEPPLPFIPVSTARQISATWWQFLSDYWARQNWVLHSSENHQAKTFCEFRTVAWYYTKDTKSQLIARYQMLLVGGYPRFLGVLNVMSRSRPGSTNNFSPNPPKLGLLKPLIIFQRGKNDRYL